MSEIPYTFLWLVQNMARPPASIPPTTASTPLKVELIIGSFIHSPLKVDLFDLLLPESQPAPQHPDEASFHPLPPIHHEFRPEQKLPPRIVSAVSALLVLSPWVVLVGLVRTLRSTYSYLNANHKITSSGATSVQQSPTSSHPVSHPLSALSEPSRSFSFGIGLTSSSDRFCFTEVFSDWLLRLLEGRLLRRRASCGRRGSELFSVSSVRYLY